MSQVRVMKRGKVYQYQFEIASQGGSRKYINKSGFVLSYPSVENPKYTKDYSHHEKLFNAFLEYTNMGKILEVTNAADLNEVVTTGNYNYLIQLAEARYNSQLSNVADIISKNKNIKVVLLAGPSSSGKTTTSKKLEIYLFICLLLCFLEFCLIKLILCGILVVIICFLIVMGLFQLWFFILGFFIIWNSILSCSFL